jgi:hypothetical protein
MLEIGDFMRANQFHDARPQPIWRVQRLRPMALQLLKPPEHRCPMVAHGEEAARMDEGCELRSVYAEGAETLYETFMDAAKGSMTIDKAKLLFAAMVDANMLGRATDDADWAAALKKTVKAAAAE